jgi:hypothetical protein
MSINHKKAYWRNRLEREEGVTKQILVAKRSMTIGSRKYPCGAVLPAAAIPPLQLKAMVDSRAVCWEPRQKGRTYPEAIDLPPPETPKPRPAVHLVEDKDVETAWHLSLQAMTRLCDGNHGQAMDLLMASPDGRDLYKRATVIACQREAKRQGKPSVTPNMAGMC